MAIGGGGILKIAILGAGAMGCLYGGKLAETGQDVCLLDIWEEHVEAINERGLKIEGIGGDRVITNVKAVTTPVNLGIADLVIIFVKAIVTSKALKEAISLIGENTMVLTLQNGLGNIEKIISVVGREKIIAGVTAHGSTMLYPGKIRHAGTGDTNIGELDGTITDRIKNLAEVFNKAGFKTNVVDNVLGFIWDKLIVNIGINALTAITGLKNGQLIEFKETEELLELSVLEAVEVAKKEGIKLNHVDFVAYTKKVCELTAENRASMLQDVSNKCKTEIEVINGAIVRKGEKLGIPTPVNKVLLNLVSVIQQTYGSDRW